VIVLREKGKRGENEKKQQVQCLWGFEGYLCEDFV
jgi:hypothetical protein